MAGKSGKGDAAGGPRQRPDAAAPSLEEFHNVVTPDWHPTPRIQITKCGCNAWYCDDCAKRRGYTLRAKLVEILKSFRARFMVTLTVDPSLFASPFEAYMYVRKRRCISRLTQDLYRGGHVHSRRYFCVVEFQKRTEFAHYHLLLDASFIRHSDILRYWAKNRPSNVGPVLGRRPAFGTVWFSAPWFRDALHAARYATKYLVKAPEAGWPDWVLNLGADIRVPRYQTSKGFWGESKAPSSASAETSPPRQRLSYRARIAGCGQTCNLFQLETRAVLDAEVHSERRLWAGKIAYPFDRVADAVPDFVLVPGRTAELLARTPRGAIEQLRQACGEAIEVVASPARRGSCE